MVNAQEWINRKYSKKERKSVKILEISRKELEGDLDLSDFLNLEEFNCSYNQITGLSLKENKKLIKLNFSANKLKEIDLRNNKKLENLYALNNLLTNNSNLDLSSCENLKHLELFN